MNRPVKIFLSIFLAGLLVCGGLPSGQSWAGADIHPRRILVKFKSSPADSPGYPGLLALAQAARARRFRIVPNLELLTIPSGKSLEAVLELFRSSPLVLYAEPDYLVSAIATPDDPLFGELWGLANTGQNGGLAGADINARAAWDISTGSPNVVVMVIDTGVDYTHPGLVDNIWNNPGEIPGNDLDDDGNGYVDDLHGINAVGLGGEVTAPSGYAVNDPVDDNGHGTHVAGTIGAAGNDGLGVVGVNWTVRIAACKFLDSSGNGYLSDAIACLQYARDLKNLGIPIVATSNSWSGPGYSRSLEEAIKSHLDADILFFAAAGNSSANSDESPEYPGAFDLPNLVAVAATDNQDLLAGFSNFGPRSIHVGAPGVNILSTCTSGLPECTNATVSYPYDSFSGTSMAAPHAAGLAALLKAQDPGRPGKTIRNLILAGGDLLASLTGTTLTGKRIDAAGSMLCSGNSVFEIRAPALEPFYAVSNSPVTLEALNISCGDPAGAVQVQIGGDTVTLHDDGVSPDPQSSDGYYSGTWTPTSAGNYTLNFHNGSETRSATVRVGPLLTYNSDDTWSYSWVTITGTNLNLLDDTYALLTLPFPLRFYGLQYTKLYVGDNGALSFSRGPVYSANGSLPDPDQAGLAAPLWDDLVPNGNQNVYWGVTGSLPNRRFVLEWRNLPHFYYSFNNVTYVTSGSATFQVIFPEESDWILFQYKKTTFGIPASYDGGVSASSGLQMNPDWGSPYSYNQAVLTNNLAIRWTPSSLPPTPRLKAEDKYVVFPNTRVGQDAHQGLFLHNIGNANLSITSLAISPSQFSLSSAPVLPLTLPPGSQQALDLVFHPASTAALSGTLTVQSNSSGGALGVPLQGQGVLSPDLTVSPAPAADFGPVLTGHTATLALHLGNQGNTNLTINSISIAGGSPAFYWTGPALPLALAGGGSRIFSLSFHPTGVSAYSDTLVISSNDPRKPAVRLALTGSGIAPPEIQLAPVFLDFQTVSIGGSKSLAFAILNTGGSLLTVNSLSLTGTGFSLPYPPSATFQINPGASQNIQVDFSPPVTAAYSGQVQVLSNAPLSPTATVSLSGTGAVPPPPLPPAPPSAFFVSPNSLDFGTLTTDSSTELTFQIENRGTKDLQISSCVSSGAGFSLVDPPSLPLTIGASLQQQIRVRFSPATPGSFEGSIAVSSNDPDVPLRIITLSGAGKAPPPPPRPQLDYAPAEIDFHNVDAGTAVIMGFSLGNLGTADLVIDAISVTGEGFSFPQPPTLPLVIAPQSARDFQVRFLPSSAGDFPGSISISSNDPVFPLAEIPARGTGLAAPAGPPHLLVSARQLDFGEVNIGEFLEMPLAVTNTAQGDLVISNLSWNGDGDFAITPPPDLPLTLTAGESQSLVIRFSPAWIGARAGNLQVASNDPDEPGLAISLSGTGAVASEKTSGCACATPGTEAGPDSGLTGLIFLLVFAVFQSRRKKKKQNTAYLS
ncbi:MAG: choice-of-anchor D domain-containing protein [bacterium]|nr:choice-of-anchor D domain-containing protein [bacterium]